MEDERSCGTSGAEKSKKGSGEVGLGDSEELRDKLTELSVEDGMGEPNEISFDGV